MKKNKAKKQICSNQNLQSFIIGHHDLLHGSCLFTFSHLETAATACNLIHAELDL